MGNEITYQSQNEKEGLDIIVFKQGQCFEIKHRFLGRMTKDKFKIPIGDFSESCWE
jgi:hypothetical protein